MDLQLPSQALWHVAYGVMHHTAIGLTRCERPFDRWTHLRWPEEQAYSAHRDTIVLVYSITAVCAGERIREPIRMMGIVRAMVDTAQAGTVGVAGGLQRISDPEHWVAKRDKTS